MVELGVRCVVFGSPPDPNVPAPHFIGVSGTKFNPVDASYVYTQMIRKEKDARSIAQHLESRLDLTRSSKCDLIAGDSIPGYTSLASMHKRLGYKIHHNNGQVFPPTPMDGEASTEVDDPLLMNPRSSLSNFGMSVGPGGERARPLSVASASTCRSSAPLPRASSEPHLRRTGLQSAGSFATFTTTTSHAQLIKSRVGPKTIRLM
mmetsp:Transcript_55473/g.164929  ORF Transcript_55473/g.164929 Transcript_55473/m.164929 type:complete len:205 (+) Transcript_55473:59-673(+)